jgi:hypothetical protein
MSGVVAIDGDEPCVRTARAVLGGRGYRVVAADEVPRGARRIIHVRRICTTAFDGFEVVVVRPAAVGDGAAAHLDSPTRKVWTAIPSPGPPARRSDAVLALVLLEFLEAYIDPSPWPAPPPRRRRRARTRRFARAG